jgi:Mn2+/Fe2+ NRAMP family transporter
MNAIVAGVGLTLGSLTAACLIIVASRLFQPRGLVPDSLDVMALAPAIPFGRAGLRLALLGMLAAIAGAAVETAMAGAYDYAQFFKLPWGRNKPPKQVPQFTAAWMAMLLGGLFLMLLGLDPLKLVEYAVVFSAVVLPFTYWPILKAAASRAGMREHANRRWLDAVGWVFLALLTLAAVAAPVLLFVTHAGEG